MNFLIRKANKDDMQEVLSLIKELALYEKEPDEVEVSREELISDGLEMKKVSAVLLRKWNPKLLGWLYFIQDIQLGRVKYYT